MPAGTWELVCHPGYSDRALEQAHTRLLASRETERSALLEVIPEAIRKDSGLMLTDFHQSGECRSVGPPMRETLVADRFRLCRTAASLAMR